MIRNGTDRSTRTTDTNQYKPSKDNIIFQFSWRNVSRPTFIASRSRGSLLRWNPIDVCSRRKFSRLKINVQSLHTYRTTKFSSSPFLLPQEATRREFLGYHPPPLSPTLNKFIDSWKARGKGDEDPILGNSEDQAGSRERACYISVMPDTISISSPCTVYYYSIQAMKTVPEEVSNGKFSRPDAIKVGSSVQMKFKAYVSSRQTSSREIQVQQIQVVPAT